MLRKLLLSLYSLASISLIIMGLIFEEPFGSRRILLIGLCTIYMLLVEGKIFYKRGSLFTTLISSLLVMLLVIIEINSKYAVNYFFHTLYLLLIFFAIIHIRSRIAIILCSIMTILSFYKFIQLIWIAPTFANISLMVFFGSFQILIVIIGIFLKVYKDESQKTKALYNELLEVHDQLKAYAGEIKFLSEVEARTHIARDLHDTLGHDLTGLIMQMEMASSYYEEEDLREGNKLLMAAKKSARDSLIKVREIVETLKANNGIYDIKDTISELITQFGEKTGLKIEFIEEQINDADEIIGNTHPLIKPEISLVLYRIIQEAMTNSVRHGKATQMKVRLAYYNHKVEFDIKDNGVGCTSIKPNNGLSGMKERVNEVGGAIEFASIPYFSIDGNIPI